MVLRRIANPFYFIGSVCSNLSILTIYAEMAEMDYGICLENRRGESLRGFESYSPRHYGGITQRKSNGLLNRKSKVQIFLPSPILKNKGYSYDYSLLYSFIVHKLPDCYQSYGEYYVICYLCI